MNKYEIIYESLQSQLDQGLITMELAEEVNDLAYEKYVMEDKSDIAAVYSRKAREEKLRSEGGNSKRPKISKNMTSGEKRMLHIYDHGHSWDNYPGVRSARGAGAERDNCRQNADYKRGVDDANKLVKKRYDDNNVDLSLYSGAGKQKRSRLRK